ncbi:MAG: hypothetical protein AAF639_47135 [Chloroflexota bacterium]
MQTKQRSTTMRTAAVRTLATSYYTSDEVLTQEKHNLFFKTWQFACHASELAEAGSYRFLIKTSCLCAPQNEKFV